MVSCIEKDATAHAFQRTTPVKFCSRNDMKEIPEIQTPVVEGSSQLYVQDNNGKWTQRYVPMPTDNPRDPLNLPTWRKALIVSSICLFGAMAIAPEQIIAALLPILALEYAGLDPHILDNFNTGIPQAPGGGVVPTSTGFLDHVGGPSYSSITLISTLPTLVIGVSNYFTVPLSIAIGRRPVIILCGLVAWIGAIWAGKSQSLGSHLGAGSLQAIGAGTVESLIPLVIQDVVFIHERNRCFSIVWAAQGVIVLTLGVCSPMIIAATSWRWLYFITAACAAVAWLVILFAVPETRFIRSSTELQGQSLQPLNGALRPLIDTTKHGPRTWRDELGFFTQGFAWQQAADSVTASFKSFFFPNVFWTIMLNSIFTAVTLAASQTAALVLLTQPNSWPCKLLGLAILPMATASFFVSLFSGYGADWTSNWLTKTLHKGRREPEIHLINLIVPLLFALAGCIMFGAGGSYIGHISWRIFVVGIGFLTFGLLGANVTFNTYVVESYPEWAGPVLVNVASLRNIIGFGCSFRTTVWIADIGFMRMFGLYAGLIAAMSLGLVPMYVYGRGIRRYCGRFVRKTSEDSRGETVRGDIGSVEIEKM